MMFDSIARYCGPVKLALKTNHWAVTKNRVIVGGDSLGMLSARTLTAHRIWGNTSCPFLLVTRSCLKAT